MPWHRFHHVSTDELYGSLGPQDAAFSESTPYATNSPYSASKAATGTSSERLITYVRDRPGHDRRYAIDSRKIQRDCAFAPRISLQAGLGATVDWYLLREDKLKAGWQRTA